MQTNLSPRAARILVALVGEYIHTGEPVGSARLAQSAGLSVSSATVRSTLAELEELGYLEQPHTSAGRIPTDRGYRYYVDHMIDSTRLSSKDVKVIESIGLGHEITARPDRLMEKASHILSELSENVGIIIWPALSENRLKQIRFMKLPDNRVLVVLVSMSN